ncbi:WD repeat-containing protein 27-like [Ischnura elegans]|uniref:WD repeat-containing protein 27-like n=1 Tax=Ischnura elegans TaxID=197161 RepID=UPI001ED8A9F3|nr:WD repeat-containing protein 27-like [Ischnura elegans]
MVLEISRSSKLSVPGGIGKYMPIFTDKHIIKVDNDGMRISVHSINNPSNAIRLLGHEAPVSCLSLSPNDTFALCSCSDDRVILWELHPFKYSVKTEAPQGIVVGENIGFVHCCSFSWSLKWLVLCLQNELWILLLQENIFKSNAEDGFSLYKILDTDSKKIDMCSFSSQHADIFVTLEDSNHFKVWNIASGEVIYRSSTVINDSIHCCSFSGIPNKLLIGTYKGVARIYHINEKFLPASFLTFTVCEENFDLPMDMEDENNTGIIQQKQEFPTNSDANSGVKKECKIFSMRIYNQRHNSNQSDLQHLQDDSQFAQEMFDSIISPGSILFICCSLGVILYDCKSCEKISSISFLGSEMVKGMANEQLNLIENVFLRGESLDEIDCWVKTSQPQPRLYQINFAYEDSSIADMHLESKISFLSSEPISKTSPLLYHMKPRNKILHALGKIEPKKKNDKIKSSGYGSHPRSTMFKPITNGNKKEAKPSMSRKSISFHHQQRCCDQGSMLKYGPPQKLVRNTKICETTGTCIKVVYSVNGSHVACNSTPTELCVLRASDMCMEKSIIIPGHDSSITSLCFNLNSKWLMSSSNDSTVKIWNWRNRQCILSINPESKQTTKSTYPVTQAGFFYLDKFAVVASKGQMDLYSYMIDESSTLQPWSDQGSSRKIKTIEFQTQHVNCFCAANQFHSHLVLAGCSNRNVMVYDLNHQKMARIMKDAHSHNPPHSLIQQTGSVCPSIPALPSQAYNLFLSTAMCDGVKLWDLRTTRCIQKYNQHVNRMYSMGIDFSPCSRFVAVCSEDRKVYLYDTRNCENYLAHLKGFSDVPMSVAFSPCMTQMEVSTLNGHLYTFT